MSFVNITFKRNVSRKVVRNIVSVLRDKTGANEVIDSWNLDVYARRLNKLDRQQKLIMVRIYVNSVAHADASKDARHIQGEVTALLEEHVKSTQIGVEVFILPAAT